MHKNYFDIVMAHIEENITWTTEEIKKEISNLIGRHSRAFSESFFLLTSYTLDYYIKQRRLHFAARELIVSIQKSICDIALEYHFSDQAAFSRAIKAKYGFTPNEIRKGDFWPNEEPFCLRDFTEGKADTQVEKMLRRMDISNHMPAEDAYLMLEIEEIEHEYSFDMDTCYQIADLAERLGISSTDLAAMCFEAVIDVKSDPHYTPAEIQIALDLGISSDEEMDAICQYFKCEPYELDDYKVSLYKKRNNSHRKEGT